jgi:hypothetical protein
MPAKRKWKDLYDPTKGSNDERSSQNFASEALTTARFLGQISKT